MDALESPLDLSHVICAAKEKGQDAVWQPSTEPEVLIRCEMALPMLVAKKGVVALAVVVAHANQAPLQWRSKLDLAFDVIPLRSVQDEESDVPYLVKMSHSLHTALRELAVGDEYTCQIKIRRRNQDISWECLLRE